MKEAGLVFTDRKKHKKYQIIFEGHRIWVSEAAFKNLCVIAGHVLHKRTGPVRLSSHMARSLQKNISRGLLSACGRGLFRIQLDPKAISATYNLIENQDYFLTSQQKILLAPILVRRTVWSSISPLRVGEFLMSAATLAFTVLANSWRR